MTARRVRLVFVLVGAVALVIGLTFAAGPVQATPGNPLSLVSPPARCCMGMAYDQVNHNIVLFGGGDTATGAPLGDTWTWDGTTWTPRTGTPSPCPMNSTRMVWDGSQIMLFGGMGKKKDGCPVDGLQNTTWLWNGATLTWKQCKPPDGCSNPAPAPRESEGMAWDQSSPPDATSGDVITFGGTSSLAGALPNVPDELQPLSSTNDTWKWDGATKEWTFLTMGSPCARNSAALALIPLGTRSCSSAAWRRPGAPACLSVIRTTRGLGAVPRGPFARRIPVTAEPRRRSVRGTGSPGILRSARPRPAGWFSLEAAAPLRHRPA
jgi:hypothetical protein